MTTPRPLNPDALGPMYEALKKAAKAVNAAYEQAYAEWRDHDRIAARCDATISEWRAASRAALALAEKGTEK